MPSQCQSNSSIFWSIETSLPSLQTASQLDSIGSGHVDIKYEDYPFTPTSMAAQNSWCALSQAWAASTNRTAISTPRNSLRPPRKLWTDGVVWTLNQGYCSIWWLHVFMLTWPAGHLTRLPYYILSPGPHLSLTRTRGARAAVLQKDECALPTARTAKPGPE